ncbi:hypothetical protein K492DRAFT_199131 [Lichtheimia hyalospora FSU 10163]|nr:hypothetical protein K492DRAFT_199131 [Lichtheimia hyalospora FSU 10163]
MAYWSGMANITWRWNTKPFREERLQIGEQALEFPIISSSSSSQALFNPFSNQPSNLRTTIMRAFTVIVATMALLLFVAPSASADECQDFCDGDDECLCEECNMC